MDLNDLSVRFGLPFKNSETSMGFVQGQSAEKHRRPVSRRPLSGEESRHSLAGQERLL